MFVVRKAKRIAIVCAPLIALALGTGCSKTQEATPAALVMENGQGSPKASAPVFITIANNSCQVVFDFCDGERTWGIRGLNNAVYYGCGVDGCPPDNVSTYGLGGELFCMQEGTTYYVLPQTCICSTMPNPPQYGHVLHITFPIDLR